MLHSKKVGQAMLRAFFVINKTFKNLMLIHAPESSRRIFLYEIIDKTVISLYCIFQDIVVKYRFGAMFLKHGWRKNKLPFHIPKFT